MPHSEKNILRENESEKVLEPQIISLFKILNEEKKNHKTKKSLLDAIENYCQFIGINPVFSLYLLELYLLNYRKDGDYKNLTKENFIDPRKMKGKWTLNTKANKFVVALLPFKGSNLEGYWDKTPKGEEYYLVKSYNWYPIYIFKDDKWYEVTKRYSSSTSRQMRNALPYNDEIREKVYLLTPEEMMMLMNGKSHEEVMQNKLKQIKKDEPSLISKRLSSTNMYQWDGLTPRTKVKYKIKGIRVENDKAIVDVDIYDVVLRDYTGRQLDTPENYLRGDLPGITKEYVEKKLTSELMKNFKDYFGKDVNFYEKPISDESKVIFNFNHLKK